MRVLITGGAGFVGSHLAEALLAARHGCSSWITCPPGHIAQLKGRPGFHYTVDSVLNDRWSPKWSTGQIRGV